MFNNCKTKECKILLLVFVGIISCLFLVLIISGVVGIIDKINTVSNIDETQPLMVRGQGKVYAKPDIAIIDLSVLTEGKNIKEVQNENSKKMNKVINFLKDFGAEDKDIKTINYQIYPRYNYEERKIPQIIGYEITQTLEIKIRNLEKIGELLDESVDAGINQVSSLRFWIDNDDKLKEEARNLAIKDAREKANILASQLGVKLVKMVGFNEEGVFDYYPYPAKEMGIGGGGETPQIQVGENEIIVNVTLTYRVD